MLTIFLCVCKDTTFESHRDERKNFFNTYCEKGFSTCYYKARQTVVRMKAKQAEQKSKRGKHKKITTLNREP
jgi:hypothetical protein